MNKNILFKFQLFQLWGLDVNRRLKSMKTNWKWHQFNSDEMNKVEALIDNDQNIRNMGKPSVEK